MRCTDIAAVKVAEVTQLIQTAVDNDAAARVTGNYGTVTSSGDVTVGKPVTPASVQLSHADTVDVEAAKQTAATVLTAGVSDAEASSSSVPHLDSVPAADVIDTGTLVQSEVYHLVIW